MINYLASLSPGWLIMIAVCGFIGLISQIALYGKAGKSGLSALVPVWNVIVFVELVGRPRKHALWILAPGTVFLVVVAIFWKEFNGLFPVWEQIGDFDGHWIHGPSTWAHMAIPLAILGAAFIPMAIFIGKIFTEICDSFGKHERRDKILCIVFNAAYLLFVIGISDIVFEGPWYAKKNNLPYTMPELKGKTNTESKSEVLAAIAAKYQKKK